MSENKATSIIFITASQDTAHKGVAVLEVAGTKRHVQLTSDYAVTYNGIKVFRNGLAVETVGGRAKPLSEIVLAVQICMVVKEHL